MKYMQQILLYTLITVVVIVVGVYVFKADKSQLESDAGDRVQSLNTTLVYPKFKTVAPFTLGGNGSEFTEADLQGKWSLVFFGYTYCPDICPTTMSVMKRFYLALPPEIQDKTQVILVSVDPERDSPQQLQQYAKAFHDDFIAVTGSHEALHALTRDFGAIYAKVGEGEDYLVDHTGKIFVIDPKGRRYAFINKSMTDPTQGYQYNLDLMLEDFLSFAD
ncbi:MAG: SCO family protein [Gammaproteobacteria bacterium]|nr:SCO family protein [Gammaproteobacteria bacterium]NVK89240.1 SCO family protein [Gammaproteobacteria bacterium]